MDRKKLTKFSNIVDFAATGVFTMALLNVYFFPNWFSIFCAYLNYAAWVTTVLDMHRLYEPGRHFYMTYRNILMPWDGIMRYHKHWKLRKEIIHMQTNGRMRMAKNRRDCPYYFSDLNGLRMIHETMKAVKNGQTTFHIKNE